MTVGIIVGSTSDLQIVEDSKMLEVLEKAEVGYELSVLSAHRHSEQLAGYCHEAWEKGIRVIIAAAGMSAALPGMIVPGTSLMIPVIGVALSSKEFPDAQDAVLSMTRLPAGCPVLYTGIGAAGLKNAAIATLQILSLTNSDIRERLKQCRDSLSAAKPPIVGINLIEKLNEIIEEGKKK
jgi:phosphoribosylaminoimidazole carboxylase PurE protein